MQKLTCCYLGLDLQTHLVLPAEAQQPTPVFGSQAFLQAKRNMAIGMQLALPVCV